MNLLLIRVHVCHLDTYLHIYKIYCSIYRQFPVWTHIAIQRIIPSLSSYIFMVPSTLALGYTAIKQRSHRRHLCLRFSDNKRCEI